MSDSTPSSLTRFQAGVSGNPNGRPKGSLSGRSKALAALDEMLSEAGNIPRLKQAFQTAFDLNPLGFFNRLVMPLIPKEAKIDLGDDGTLEIIWAPISDTPRTRLNGESMTALPASGSSAVDGDGEKPSAAP